MNVTTPVEKETLKSLKVGDVVYITGEILSIRDQAYKKLLGMLKKGKKAPFEINGQVFYHCGPLAVKKEKWKIISAGPTTSSRMENLIVELARFVKTVIFIGKGELSWKFTEAMRGKGAYFVFPGGAGSLAAKYIKEVKKVYWQELGMAEAVWKLKVENFGPCLVAIDSRGSNLFEKIKNEVENKYKEVLKEDFEIKNLFWK